MLDITNFTTLMSALIRRTLPLAGVLKGKPELWKEVGKYLRQIGIDVPVITDKVPIIKSDAGKRNFEPVPLNKVDIL